MKEANTVILGSDHAGFELKEKLKKYFQQKHIPYEDLSPRKIEGDDYPNIAFAVGRRVVKMKGSRGVLVCGSGEGVTIAANKVRGVRAVAPYDTYTAKMSRLHNNANILGLSGWHFSQAKAQNILSVWLKTPFSGDTRHVRRIRKIAAYRGR